MTTVSDVINEAVILLNDPNKRLFTDAKLLPLIKKAYRELSVELHNNGAPLLNEISDSINVPQGNKTLGSDQPDDIVIPVRLKERGSDAEEFSDMIEQYWESANKPGPSLIFWSWRDEELQFRGATTDRQIIIYYRKSFSAIEDVTSKVAYANAINFLSPRAAALAARFIGNSDTRADKLDMDAAVNLNNLISRTVKGTQSNTARRKSYWQYLRTRQGR